MTDRERWTVYPLLFLALGIAVKDKVLPSSVDVDQVSCKHAWWSGTARTAMQRGGRHRSRSAAVMPAAMGQIATSSIVAGLPQQRGRR